MAIVRIKIDQFPKLRTILLQILRNIEAGIEMVVEETEIGNEKDTSQDMVDQVDMSTVIGTDTRDDIHQQDTEDLNPDSGIDTEQQLLEFKVHITDILYDRFFPTTKRTIPVQDENMEADLLRKLVQRLFPPACTI